MFKNYLKKKLLIKSECTMKKNFTSTTTIFDKIISKEIKSDIIYEDDEVLAFKDINPVSPIHILIIPKIKDGLSGISQAEEKNIKTLGILLLTAKKLGDKLNVKDGYRLVINEGKHAGQTVNHLHIHFLAGKQFGWPPGTETSNIKF